MSKNSGNKRPNNVEQYNSSSAPTVWIVVAISVVLAVVALMETAI